MRSAIYRNTEYCKLNNWSIYAIGDEIVADRVLRYENLADEISRLLKDLKVEADLEMPRMRSYVPDRPHYSTFYSDWTRDLVARWYAREIEAFGYRFEMEKAADAGIGNDAVQMAANANE